jgi:hypothetical protein
LKLFSFGETKEALCQGLNICAIWREDHLGRKHPINRTPGWDIASHIKFLVNYTHFFHVCQYSLSHRFNKNIHIN